MLGLYFSNLFFQITQCMSVNKTLLYFVQTAQKYNCGFTLYYPMTHWVFDVSACNACIESMIHLASPKHSTVTCTFNNRTEGKKTQLITKYFFIVSTTSSLKFMRKSPQFTSLLQLFCLTTTQLSASHSRIDLVFFHYLLIHPAH